MNNTFDKTAIETIDLLEARLRRIEFATCGQVKDAPAGNGQPSAIQRLGKLESSLHQVASKSRVVQDLLRLHSKFPDLFQSIDPHDMPSTLDISSITSIIMASASSYPSTASRLTSILDAPIPPAEMSTQLIDLQPRVANIGALQAVHDSEIAELRQRSAAVIQKWYNMDILQAGDNWAEITGRVEQVEQHTRRIALAKRMDDELI